MNICVSALRSKIKLKVHGRCKNSKILKRDKMLDKNHGSGIVGLLGMELWSVEDTRL